MANMIYNGVKLPAMPAVISEYPCATLEKESSISGSYDDRYYLVLSKGKGVVNADDELTIPAGTMLYYRAYGTDTAWTEDDHGEDDYVNALDNILWTNYGVEDDTGAVVFEATDPVLAPDKYYRYNGVKLIELPENDALYPYKYIIATPEQYQEYVTFKYALFYSTHRAVYDPDAGDVIIPADADYVVRLYEVAPDDTRFVRTGMEDNDNGNRLSLTYADLGGFDMLWANTDILNSSTGAVYFEASNPVAVRSYDKMSFLAGLAALLMCGGELRIGKYSYNGTVLPKLPKWNREACPYAVIVCNPGFGFYGLWLCDTIPCREDTEALWMLPEDTNYIAYTLNYPYESGMWDNKRVSQGGQYLYNTPLWANVDVKDADGTLVIAASNPVPV